MSDELKPGERISTLDFLNDAEANRLAIFTVDALEGRDTPRALNRDIVAVLSLMTAEIERLRAELAEARGQRDELRAILASIEWTQQAGFTYCPICHGPRDLGHDPDCYHATTVPDDATTTGATP